MSGYCKCGVYHEEDDDRPCGKCVEKERQVNIEDTNPIDVLASRIWSGTHWYYPHIDKMLAELRRLRKLEADAKAAGFIDERGEVRKVLGTLRKTADNCIIGHGARVYQTILVRGGPKVEFWDVALVSDPEPNQLRNAFVCWGGPYHDCDDVETCYSTSEAAIAARDGSIQKKAKENL